MTVKREIGGVRLLVVDDENGFVETPLEVRRLSGTGLSGLADHDEATLANMVDELQVPTANGHPDRRDLTIAVTGPDALTAPLLDIAARTEGLSLAAAEDADVLLAATASLFDPEVSRACSSRVDSAATVLTYGVIRAGVSFVGPLWSPRRFGACYECLRSRIISNSTHGATWRAYADHLARTGTAPLQHEIEPWAATLLAAEAVKWLRGPEQPADRLLWWEPSAGGVAVRHLLAVPHCPVCGGQGAEPTQVAELADAEDDRVGIVHASTVRRAQSGPPVYLSGSTSADFALIRPAMRVTRNGGAGFTKRDAINATLGESLERYAAGWYRADRLRLAAWSELDEPAVRPTEFGFYNAEQYARPGFPYVPFRDDTPVRWTPARRLDTDETVLLPASQVFMHYRLARGELPIGASISTGMAAGPTPTEATLSGLYEVLERDALAISWLHRLPPRPVAPEIVAASSEVSYHVERASSWRVRFFDVSLDLAPAAIVAVMDQHDGAGPIMSFGSACRWSPVDAVQKAFLEAAQGQTYVRRLLAQHEDWHVAEDFGDVDDFNKHAILYSKYPGLRERAGYLVDPSTSPACARPERPAPDPLEPAEALRAIAAELAAGGHPAYVVELTTPDVRQLGAHVVRVVVPGLQHLAGQHAFRLLGNRRLTDVVARLGVDSRPDNPYPHPLP